MARPSFIKHLLKLDKFGYEVEMHYQGNSIYKTMFGTLVSVLTYVLILINALGVFSDFINNDANTEVTRNIYVDVQGLGE